MNDLMSAARTWGIEPGYYDVFGNWHDASAETISRLLMALSGGRDPPRFDVPLPSANALRAWQGEGRGRWWAMAVQLYAIRSRRNWGHGDFGDLARLIEITANCGAAGIGLNPLHALFIDHAEQASPYAPNSRLFLNPLYIDIEAIPEFPGAPSDLVGEIDSVRAGDLIDYRGVARVKLAGFRLAYEHFSNAAADKRRQDLESYRMEQGEALLRFACFEVLRQKYAPTPWQTWPQPWRNPDRATLEQFRRDHHADCEFQEFLQWTADRQLKACIDAARKLRMPIGLYVDLAVGIDPAGADAWSRPDAVVSAVSVGAPPDAFNRAGQDWGLAPFNPLTLAADDFAAVRELMRAVMRHAGAIRIDHVMGLKRVFMIPRGLGPREGAYVRFPFEPLLQVIAEESCRHRCIVIGEDLGTVPEGFRETLARWGLWSYRVMLFERDGEGRFLAPECYPSEAVATFTTHDLPSFQGWLRSHDLRVKRGLGLDPGESDEARAWAQHMLRTILGERAPGFAADDPAAIACFLGATPSRLAVMSLDDVVGEVEQVNIPATVDEHPNWRRRLSVPLEDLSAHQGLRRVAEAFAQAGRSFR